MCSKAPVNRSSRFASQVSGRRRSPSLWLEPDHASNTTHALSVPDRQIGRLLCGVLGKACRISIGPPGWLGLSVPLRWRPAHGSERSNECSARAGRARNHVPFGPSQGATHQCRQEPKSVVSRSLGRGLRAVLYVRSHRLQGKQYSSCSCSRLTLPSRGRLTGYALRPPLMSNVRRLK